MFNSIHATQSLKRAYFKEVKKRGRFIKSKKWDHFFEETINKFSSHSDWNEELYVKFLFDRYDFVYPQQLKTEKYFKEYLDYYPSVTVSENLKTENIVRKIGVDLKIIQKEHNKNLFIRINWNTISKYILCWSNEFLDLNKEENIMSHDHIIRYRTFFHNKQKLRDLIKRIVNETISID